MVRKVCIVGSGNWGSVIAKIIGLNIQGKPEEFHEKLPMYVYEELVDGVKLTELINTQHVNVKYMPSCILPNNVVAIADVVETVKDADIIVFVLPHQFMERICTSLEGKVKPTAVGVSLIKGLDISLGRLDLVTNVVRRHLKIECAVLMGANIAPEVARENYCEATIGCKDKEMGKVLKQIFQTPYFRITVVPDEKTVELCGALKNIVALGAGFVDGMDYGDNTKAAVIRLGLMEMVAFAKEFFQNEDIGTFFESCGVADLVTTCYSGRNKRIAEAFAKNPEKSIEILEAELLNGQKLQGPPTAAEVNAILKKEGIEDRYPLFTAIHRICVGECKPQAFIDCLRNHPAHHP